MSRRLLSTAAALMLAGGVYLSAGTAEASNMGFKLERSFSYVTGNQNLYLVSFPLFNGLGDIATSDAAAGYSCEVGDGRWDAADALCDLTTDRDMSLGGALMTIQRLNEGNCSFEGATILKLGANVSFVGTMFELTTPENREVGYFVNVNKNPGDPDLENRAVIVGSHDPSWTGKTIDRACAFTVLNLPYHTMYRRANEILCGLQGMDWMPSDPGNPDSDPDACDGGLYDPVSGASVTTQTFVNGTGYLGRTAFSAGGVRFVGTNFDLTPGDAYLFNMGAAYLARDWTPPHF